LWDRLAPPAQPRVLDVGCGFGATVLTWARAHQGSFVGLTPSGVQVARARAQARALGVSDRCTFRAQTYDEPIEGRFDRVVSVEALCHADALPDALASIATSTVAHGRLVAVEDVAVDAGVAADRDGCELRARWSTSNLYARATWLEALATAGFALRAVHDLTPQVRPRAAAVLSRTARTLRWVRAALPTSGSRAVADAFLGGVALERLYAKGAMRYLAFEAERVEA
jgi:cyclopropane fatty-acyl-phospholipid synthase-like methyltransferase